MSDDPILKKIFNRFYPKSQTSDAGRKLYILAWIIEILVVVAGLATAYIFLPEGVDKAIGISIAVTFMVAAIAELTKIPLATAFYYEVKLNWKLSWLIALFLINFLTFETIVNGLLRNYNVSTQPIRADVISLASITRERINGDLIATNKINEIRKEIKTINDAKDEAFAQKSKIRIQNKAEIDNLKLTSKDGGTLQNYLDTKKEKQDQIDKLNDQKIKLSTSGCQNDFFGDDECSKQARAENALQDRITILSTEVSDLDTKIQKLNAQIDAGDGERINSLNAKYAEQIASIDEQLERYNSQVTSAQDRIKAYDIDSIERIARSKDLEKQEKELIDKINIAASLNNFYVIAQMIKGNPDKSEDVEESSWLDFTWLKVDNRDQNIIIKDDEVNNKLTPELDAGTESLLSHTEDQYHLLTSADLKFAFWLFFGSMALVISLAGSLVAVASLRLMDQRAHEERISAKSIGPVAKFFRSIQFMFMSLRKRLMKPKIVEVINEKEVIVEKEVIKEVPVDKIVFRDVPKEVIRRELVHVPMYTNDKQLLGTTTFKDMDVTTEELDKILEEIRKKNEKTVTSKEETKED